MKIAKFYQIPYGEDVPNPGDTFTESNSLILVQKSNNTEFDIMYSDSNKKVYKLNNSMPGVLKGYNFQISHAYAFSPDIAKLSNQFSNIYLYNGEVKMGNLREFNSNSTVIVRDTELDNLNIVIDDKIRDLISEYTNFDGTEAIDGIKVITFYNNTIGISLMEKSKGIHIVNVGSKLTNLDNTWFYVKPFQKSLRTNNTTTGLVGDMVGTLSPQNLAGANLFKYGRNSDVEDSEIEIAIFSRDNTFDIVDSSEETVLFSSTPVGDNYNNQIVFTIDEFKSLPDRCILKKTN